MADGGDAAVSVAVRVRPFNGREKAQGAKRCIDMAGKTTTVYETDVEEEGGYKDFTFDYSLWSHYDMANDPAGHNEEYPDRPNVDQQFLYDMIGVSLLRDFWEGFDVCMFAYGQSGAGKSFSMTGTGPRCPAKWQGMIPRICRGVFELAEETTAKDPNTTFTIMASMLEIYLGKIYDLLISPESYNVKTREELQMQMDDVAGLSWLPVSDTDSVGDLLVRGFSNQYKAPTGLNVDSSRGHTIYTLRVQRTIKNPKAKKKKDREQVITTAMRLVDLAGSERTEKVLEITKAQLAGLLQEKYKKACTVSDEQMALYKEERTAEGRSINQSLTNLGQCVKQVAKYSEVADEAERNRKMGQIGWRTSALTRLLKTALNGRCKTIMIAAVSPSLSERDETVSTMRYANNIKMIKSCAVKKAAVETEEQRMAKKIKELEEKLAAVMAGGGGGGDGGGGGGGEASEEVLRQLKEMKEAETEAKRREQVMAAEMERLRQEHKKRQQIKEGPHLIAILSSELSDGLYVTPIEAGQPLVAAHQQLESGLPLLGAGISRTKPHCSFSNAGGEITFTPEANAPCMVNGKNVKSAMKLSHNDRIRLGGNNFFRLVLPDVMATLPPAQVEHDDAIYTYDFVKEESMKEVMAAFGADSDKEEEEKRRKAIDEELKKRDAEFHKQQEDARKKVEAERVAFEKQMKALQDQFASSSSQDKEAMAKIAREKEEFERKMRENELMLKAKLEEEERYKKDKLKEEERLAKKRATAKAKLQYDLMDAIPFVRTSNEYAAELNVPAQYEVKIVQEETPDGGPTMAVNVQLKDTNTGKIEIWDMDTFRTRYGQIMQDYHDNIKNIKEGKPVRLSRDSAFVVSDNAVTTIGSAKCMLNYLFYNMEINDKFHIVSHAGQVMGSVHLKITPVWDGEAQEDQVLESESMLDVTSLKFLDLDVSISKCEALPPTLACNVQCAFAFPDWISTSVVDPEEAKLRSRAKEIKELKRQRQKAKGDDFMDDDDEEEEGELAATVMGAAFSTDPDYKGHDEVQVNPPVGWEKRIRIHNMNKRIIEWFKDNALIVKVSGRGPSKDREAVLIAPSVAAASAAAAAAAAAVPVEVLVDGKTAQQLHDELAHARREREEMTKALEEARRAAQDAVEQSKNAALAQQQATVEAVKAGKVSADAELKKEITRLQEEARKAGDDLRNKTLALERLAAGNDVGSVRNRIKDVVLPLGPLKATVTPGGNGEVQVRTEYRADPEAVNKAVDGATAQLRAQLEDAQRKLDSEKKKSEKAAADLKAFKAEWDLGGHTISLAPAAAAAASAGSSSSPRGGNEAGRSSASVAPEGGAAAGGDAQSKSCTIL